MRKNKMMRLASALLVAVLLSTCAISGTFAKYVSEATATDTARVAKWGWGDTTLSIDLFATNYDGTVQSSNGDKLIAPGTKNTASLVWTPDAKFAPEVDYTLSFTVAAATDIPDVIEAQLKWTMQIDGGVVKEYDTFADLEADLEAKTYAGEASLTGPTVNIQIGWAWEYDDGDNATDTALGNLETLPALTVAITMTATQVD